MSFLHLSILAWDTATIVILSPLSSGVRHGYYCHSFISQFWRETLLLLSFLHLSILAWDTATIVIRPPLNSGVRHCYYYHSLTSQFWRETPLLLSFLHLSILAWDTATIVIPSPLNSGVRHCYYFIMARLTVSRPEAVTYRDSGRKTTEFLGKEKKFPGLHTSEAMKIKKVSLLWPILNMCQ